MYNNSHGRLLPGMSGRYDCPSSLIIDVNVGRCGENSNKRDFSKRPAWAEGGERLRTISSLSGKSASSCSFEHCFYYTADYNELGDRIIIVTSR